MDPGGKNDAKKAPAPATTKQAPVKQAPMVVASAKQAEPAKTPTAKQAPSAKVPFAPALKAPTNRVSPAQQQPASASKGPAKWPPSAQSTGSMSVPLRWTSPSQPSAREPSATSSRQKFTDGGSAANNVATRCYFKDGVRRVDYVIVWEESLDPAESEKPAERQKAIYRRNFEYNLLSCGVEIERETSTSLKNRIHYLKLFITWETMCYYAEYLGFPAPLQEHSRDFSPYSGFDVQKAPQFFSRALELNIPKSPKQFYTSPFSAEKMGQYLGSKDKDTYFRPTQRFEIAYEILGTQTFGRKDLCEVGIGNMIKKGIYKCAFPPHDGPAMVPDGLPTEKMNARQVLLKYWAQWKLFYKFQPLDHVREYYGEKIAFYFAFLGYYTVWLIPASIVGLAVSIYSWVQIDGHPIVKEVCEGDDFIMCPNLYLSQDRTWSLKDICTLIRFTYMVDNYGTVLYSLFVSFWACAFLESWKRKSASLAYDWNVSDFKELQERPRPEYTARCTEYEEDPVTGAMEPHFPAVRRCFRLLWGVLSLVGMVGLSAISLFLMVILHKKIIVDLSDNPMFRSQAITIANFASAAVNLIFVLILELIYEKIAFNITDWEMHRTQTQYENQVIVKVCVFEIFNYYISISFTALAKGKSDEDAYMGRYTCMSGNCMLELAQLLAVIIVGKQVAVNVIEVLLPKLLTFVHRGLSGLKENTQKQLKQWEADYMMISYDETLFMEYLETIMQFGFITLFVPAFPLAPLFAMLNNLVEIRMDARKLVCGSRRPLPERTQSIGIWFKMLQATVFLATLSNALLIAFTSEFIPFTLYRIEFDPTGHGYKNFTLGSKVLNDTGKTCRFVQYNSGNQMHFYWKLMAIRIIFALGYQQFVATVSTVISQLIPDMSQELKMKIKRQKFLAKQALVDREMTRRKRRVTLLA